MVVVQMRDRKALGGRLLDARAGQRFGGNAYGARRLEEAGRGVEMPRKPSRPPGGVFWR
jgi:hypothetical protein